MNRARSFVSRAGGAAGSQGRSCDTCRMRLGIVACAALLAACLVAFLVSAPPAATPTAILRGSRGAGERDAAGTAANRYQATVGPRSAMARATSSSPGYSTENPRAAGTRRSSGAFARRRVVGRSSTRTPTADAVQRRVWPEQHHQGLQGLGRGRTDPLPDVRRGPALAPGELPPQGNEIRRPGPRTAGA